MADLAQLSVKQLRERAAELGVDHDRIETARDGDDPCHDLATLIRAREQSCAIPTEASAPPAVLVQSLNGPEPGPKVQRWRSDDTEPDWLARLLAGARLGEHLAKFRALRCADGEDVRCMGRETLSGIGLTPVEVKRLQRQVERHLGPEQLVVQADFASLPTACDGASTVRLPKARRSVLCGVLSAVAVVALVVGPGDDLVVVEDHRVAGAESPGAEGAEDLRVFHLRSHRRVVLPLGRLALRSRHVWLVGTEVSARALVLGRLRRACGRRCCD